jgi:hypothetical protein
LYPLTVASLASQFKVTVWLPVPSCLEFAVTDAHPFSTHKHASTMNNAAKFRPAIVPAQTGVSRYCMVSARP